MTEGHIFESLCPSTIGSELEGKLILEDGSEFYGRSFGYEQSATGEVVFNTSMVGYPESLTDPSYRGQILVLTYPIIGNYGVPSRDIVDQFNLPKYLESDKINVSGLIVLDYCHDYSHWSACKSLGEWLKEEKIPALYGIDTRLLAKKLRITGFLLGKIEFSGKPISILDQSSRNLVAEVSRKTVDVYNVGKPLKIVAFDCGIKYNIIRSLLKLDVQVTVVPYNFDLEKHFDEFDGIFISNGPGDPMMAIDTINSIKFAITQNKPIFGICLGNQLLALAAGAKTYKMKFGNRASNVPVIDLRTSRCYITAQNHGYAIDESSLPDGWVPLFMNANDFSNEGIAHKTKPFFSSQFHPEACGGPTDTYHLFSVFYRSVIEGRLALETIPKALFVRKLVKKVLLLGSGGLSIGQAGEFDYSGSQAIKALKEENVEVILINPNIATVQTSRGMATRTYLLPVNPYFVERVIKKERPDHLLISMGGQTALNVGIKLYDSGILSKYDVNILGTTIEAVRSTEDRNIFVEELEKIGEHVAPCISALSLEEGLEVVKQIGYPVLVRAAFTLGGFGSGFATNDEEFKQVVSMALSISPSILIDQDLRGWKEIEYEVVRDNLDNCITVCNMENFDPLGIHTGDSIVVAPSQTLTNSEFHMLRETSIKVIRHFGIIGECNIQYALDPNSSKYYIIEVNARLSRSSALASKATGYPLAYVAAKLALGKNLADLRNKVTQVTTACFEPSLDYLVCKIPRWDLNKFYRVSNLLGSSMKSVGEVMAIGRKFEEVIQKAIRMVNPSIDGFEPLPNNNFPNSELDQKLQNPDHNRIYYIAEAFERSYTVDNIYDLTRIDKWFLSKLYNIHQLKQKYLKTDLHLLTKNDFITLKCNGFSDFQIAKFSLSEEVDVRKYRISHNVVPSVKQIDTLAAEFPASTNYLYITYNGSENDLDFPDHGVMILGCGPYSIGSSVEFDWAAVNATRTLRASNIKTIVVNFNPETVSTDYDESDRLYFEELSLERLLDIYFLENSRGVIVSVGGQIPNNLANPLKKNGVKIFGTDPEMIERAENREIFSSLLDSLSIDQPEWDILSSYESAVQFAEKAGFPVLVRPSFVLSGAAMSVAYNKEQLEEFLQRAVDFNAETPVVISKFIFPAKEIEFDAVAKDGELLIYAISEHLEYAGVHSGDATLILPNQKLYVQTTLEARRIAESICRSLKITGPFNIQLIAEENALKVIECNLRASRTLPFISKTLNVNFIDLATKVMCGIHYDVKNFHLINYNYTCVKVPQFSFTRLQGADPVLGVEMSSTGEVACFGRDFHEAYLKSKIAAGFKIPPPGSTIALTIGTSNDKANFDSFFLMLLNIGYKVIGTVGNYNYFKALGKIELIEKSGVISKKNILHYIRERKVSLIINIPRKECPEEITEGYRIRRDAMDFGVQLITNLKDATALVLALYNKHKYSDDKFYDISSMEELYFNSNISSN